MKRAWIPGLLLLAACQFVPFGYSEPFPDPVEPPPYLPEIVFRKPADFRIHDVAAGKEYFYYLYQDAYIKQEIVTVLDHSLPDPGAKPHKANGREHERAMTLLMNEWHATGDDSQVLYSAKVPQAELILDVDQNKYEYFRKLVSEGRARRDTMLDEKIRYKAHALKELQEAHHDLKADLLAREETKTFLDPQQIRFLKQQIGQRQYEVMVSEAQLKILEYRRYLRDQAYAK